MGMTRVSAAMAALWKVGAQAQRLVYASHDRRVARDSAS